MSQGAGRETHLTHIDGGKTRHWQARCEGATLTQTTWIDNGTISGAFTAVRITAPFSSISGPYPKQASGS